MKRDDIAHLPPLHPHCRTVTMPIFAGEEPAEWGDASDPKTVRGFGSIPHVPIGAVRAPGGATGDLGPRTGDAGDSVTVRHDQATPVRSATRIVLPDVEQRAAAPIVGTRASDRLIIADDRLRERLSPVLEFLDGVIDLDRLHEVHVAEAGSLARGAGASYSDGGRAVHGGPPLQARIILTAHRHYRAPRLFHELWHALDAHALIEPENRTPGRIASASELAGIGVGPPSMLRLVADLRSGPRFTEWAAAAETSDSLRWMILPQELSARAFAQWMTSRLGYHLHDSWLHDRLSSQWTAEEFGTIDAALTALLEDMRMAKASIDPASRFKVSDDDGKVEGGSGWERDCLLLHRNPDGTEEDMSVLGPILAREIRDKRIAAGLPLVGKSYSERLMAATTDAEREAAK